jgi:hypothetical protein
MVEPRGGKELTEPKKQRLEERLIDERLET